MARIATAIADALDRSIAANEITHIDTHGDEAPVMLSALDLLADDSADCGEVVEFWGKTATGDEWRVHLHRGVQS